MTPDPVPAIDLRPLTAADRVPWARLLATCFDRSPEQMEALLAWFHAGFTLVTMGAWDGDRLVAQYNCRLLELRIPGMAGLVPGRDGPEHGRRSRAIAAGACWTSSRRPCTRRSRGRAAWPAWGSRAPGVSRSRGRAGTTPTRCSDRWCPLPSPSAARATPRRWRVRGVARGGDGPVAPDDDLVRYAVTPGTLRHRFAEHPFRRYAYAVRRREGVIDGLVVYRPRACAASRACPSWRRTATTSAPCSAASRRRSAPAAATSSTLSSRPRRRSGPPHLDRARVLGAVTRNPYHLIARALVADAPASLFDLDRWDCAGGDIL